MEALRKRPLLWFFVLAYAVTWLLWSPAVLLGLPTFATAEHAPNWYLLPGVAIGVTGTAFAMTAVTDGRAGVRELLARLVRWRVGWPWYVVAVLLIPLGQLGVAFVLGCSDAPAALTPAALTAYPAAYAAHFVFGPLFEESGWRGFALPRMQQRFGPLRATALLGLLWSGWHVFLYAPAWFSGDAREGLVDTAFFTVFTVAISVVFTWLANNTQASLLLAILLHGSVDGTASYLAVLADRGTISADTVAVSTGGGVTVVCVVAAAVLIVATRGRLGRRFDRQSPPGS